MSQTFDKSLEIYQWYVQWSLCQRWWLRLFWASLKSVERHISCLLPKSQMCELERRHASHISQQCLAKPELASKQPYYYRAVFELYKINANTKKHNCLSSMSLSCPARAPWQILICWTLSFWIANMLYTVQWWGEHVWLHCETRWIWMATLAWTDSSLDLPQGWREPQILTTYYPNNGLSPIREAFLIATERQ